MITNIRTIIIQKLIDINERIVFYPKLRTTYKEILKNQHSHNIIDVGANKGQSIDFFLSITKNSKIYAFEPNPSLFKKLQLKYANYPTVFLNNKGVSDKNGTLLFNENILNETSTFEDLNYDSTYLKKKAKILGVKPENIIVNKYEVEVCKISDYILNNNLDTIDVLKIDVEGHEYQCLKGLFESNVKDKVKFIQLESHSDDMYVNKGNHLPIKEILKNNGFEEFKKIKHGFGDFYEIIYFNSFLK